MLGQVGARRHGKVMVIGDGTVGRHAACAAVGVGANVYLFGRDMTREADVKKGVSEDIKFVLANAKNIAEHVPETDLLVGAVLRRGGRAPELITEAMVQSMQSGSVIVDISIDQRGCAAKARPTSHSAPIYMEHGLIDYCVPNMPGAYPRTSNIALTDATLPPRSHLLPSGRGGSGAHARIRGFLEARWLTRSASRRPTGPCEQRGAGPGRRRPDGEGGGERWHGKGGPTPARKSGIGAACRAGGRDSSHRADPSGGSKTRSRTRGLRKARSRGALRSRPRTVRTRRATTFPTLRPKSP